MHDELLEPLRTDPSAAAILCDVDGTLAPIIGDHAASAVPESTREVLGGLVSRYALVGCLTGRRSLDARRIVGVEGIAFAGNHGFETLAPGEDEPMADPAVGGRERGPRRLVEGLDPDDLAAAGLRVEDKGAIQALHWRRAASEEVAAARAQEVADLALAAGLVPRWGRKVLEIRPVAGIDKGVAARRMIRDAGARTALFGGDDATDLDAFEALRWMTRSERLEAGVCVGVASSEQPDGIEDRVDLMVDGPEGFAGVLEALL